MNNRRSFLTKAILSASAFLLKSNSMFGASSTTSEITLTKANANNPYVFLNTDDLKDMVDRIKDTKGANDIVKSPDLPYTVRMISEKQMFAKEFEIHDFKDHIVQVLAGTTHFDVGGVPLDARVTGSGEQLAQNIRNSASVTMRVGDVLVIPRGVPHKRTTTGSAVLLMMSVLAPNPVPAK